MYAESLEKLRVRVEQLKADGATEGLAELQRAAQRLHEEHALEGDVGAGLGNTAKRLALGKGKKAS